MVKFDNLSIGADNIFWDFGDGNTSTQINPIHNYAIKGIYSVTLSVSNNLIVARDKRDKILAELVSIEAMSTNNGYEENNNLEDIIMSNESISRYYGLMVLLVMEWLTICLQVLVNLMLL